MCNLYQQKNEKSCDLYPVSNKETSFLVCYMIHVTRYTYSAVCYRLQDTCYMIPPYTRTVWGLLLLVSSS